MSFYSQPKYSALSIRKNDIEIELSENVTVFIQNISLDIYNVNVMVSGYELLIHITEFDVEDIGNYAVGITNKFGYSYCAVQLRPQGKVMFYLYYMVIVFILLYHI